MRRTSTSGPVPGPAPAGPRPERAVGLAVDGLTRAELRILVEVLDQLWQRHLLGGGSGGSGTPIAGPRLVLFTPSATELAAELAPAGAVGLPERARPVVIVRTTHAGPVLIFFLRHEHDQPRAAPMITRGHGGTRRWIWWLKIKLSAAEEAAIGSGSWNG